MYTVRLYSTDTHSYSINKGFTALNDALGFATRHPFISAVVEGEIEGKIALYKRGRVDTYHNDFRAIVHEYERVFPE